MSNRTPSNATCRLAIDPGYSRSGAGCACAYFQGTVLRRVWFERPCSERTTLSTLDPAARVTRVIYELPQYDGRASDVPHETLIQLTRAGAELAGIYAGHHSARALVAVRPAEWKHPNQKPKTHYRLWQMLDATARAVLGGDATAQAIEAALEKGASCRWAKRRDGWYPNGFVTHNLLDAVGIALHDLTGEII